MTLDEFDDNTIKQAIALYYDGNNAPVITAKGRHNEAEEIIRIAKEHDIPLCDNAALVNILSELELGEHIPKALYISVAYIIAFAYDLTSSTHKKPL